MHERTAATPATAFWPRLRLLALALLVASGCLVGLFAFVHAPVAAQPVAADPAQSVAQASVSFPVRHPFGTGSDNTVAVAVGDMDGDGDLDIVAGNQGEPGSISFNDGHGNYPTSGLVPFGSPGAATDLATADLDGDGDLDVVVSADDGACVRYLNDGSGSLMEGEAVASSVGPGNDSRLALGDLDSDGDFDIVLTRRNGPTLLRFNDGTALFPVSDTLGIMGAKAASVALGHFDDNRRLDVVVAPARGKGALFYRAADGREIVRSWGTTDQEVRDITVGDFSGDGELDFVATQAGEVKNKNHKPYKLYLNPGARDVGVQSIHELQESKAFGQGQGELWSVAAGDLNGDGSLDLVTGIGAKGWLSRIALNAGDGKFPPGQMVGFGPPDQNTRAVAVADVNADGFLDLITGNRGFPNVVYLNGQELAFAATDLHTRLSAPMQVTSVAAGDINGDGRLDIVAGNLRDGTNDRDRVFVNKNNGDSDLWSESIGLASKNTWSIALADLNGDDWLDVIAGGEKGTVTIQLNDQRGRFPVTKTQTIAVTAAHTTSLATGDLDHANGIDLAACRLTSGCTVYFNDGAGQFSAGRASSLGGPSDPSAAVAIADLNGDGELDIVVGNRNAQNYVYYNDGKGGFPAQLREPFGAGSDFTWAVAVADVNADGRSDILAGNFFESGAIYLNDGEGRFPAALARPFGSSIDRTYSLAAGDINGDSLVDFVAGNWGTDTTPRQNVLYLNDGAGNFVATPIGQPYWTRSVALGDMDGNGTVDVIEGNRFGNETLRVHYNRLRDPDDQGNRMPTIAITRPVATKNAAMLSSPQLLAAGSIPVTFTLRDPESESVGRVTLRYSLDGGGRWTPIEVTDPLLVGHLTTSPDDVSYQIHWDTQSSGVFGRSDNAVLQLYAYLQPDRPAEQGTYRYTDTIPSLNQWPYITATTFPFSIQGTSVKVFSSTEPYSEAVVYLLPASEDSYAAPLGGLEDPYRTSASGLLAGRAEMTINPDPKKSDHLVALWPAAEVTATTPARFYASADGFPMTTTVGSDIQSRLVISDARRIAAINVWADISATVPLSLTLETPRGDRIPLHAGFLPPGEPLCAAAAPGGACEVARRIFTPTLPAPAQPLAEGAWTLVASTPVTEPAQLHGWGLALKLSPLHYTSAAPTTSGLASHPVTTTGVQTLTVSSEYPLLLFDLNVALEWDASQDDQYQAQLSADLRRASELLYDWTNGQAALGNVRVYHDARRNTLPDGANAWNNAHVRVFASNRLRPNADQGGVISELYTETVELADTPQTGVLTRTIAYLPGQVRMGATWNRYGDATAGSLGDDWPAAFAHELGHYLLFLDDNYLTLAENLIVPLDDDACPGAMNNPYSNAYSEFHPEKGWQITDCRKTLSQLNTGRSDWQTIRHFYPELHAPTGTFTETEKGPSLLPLAVTQVTWQAPDPDSDTLAWLAQALGKTNDVVTSTAPLEAPIFYLKPEKAGETYRASSQARAFLFQGAAYPTVIDLGQPGSDQVLAHGARPLDRLCVYDQPQGLVGCEDVVAGDDQVTMRPAPGWEPQLMITPVTTRTLQISLTLPLTDVNTGLTLLARLYPSDAPSPSALTMISMTTGSEIVYSVPITTEAQVLEGYVWVGSPEDDARGPRQAVTEFAIGGNPVRIRSMRSPADPRAVRIRSMRVRIRSMRAPAASTDGQVMVYPDETVLPADTEWSFTLQPATQLPAEIPWATQVGRAYWLTASDNIKQNLGESSITFEYLSSDVPAGEEAFVRMYFWEESREQCPSQEAPCWRLLEDQEPHPEDHLISARLAGPGLYALFSHYEIPLNPGWNLVGYPVQGTRPITDALASIAGEYSMVFGFDDAASPTDPWAVYLPGDEGWVNDLQELRFGSGYWIKVNDSDPGAEGVVLRLKGNPQITQPFTTTLAADTLHNPPALYYGTLQSDRADFIPTPGRAVMAYLGKTLCGEGQLDDELRYVVKVRAASASEVCGTPGAAVSFQVAGLPDVTLVAPAWDNGAPHRQDLRIPAASVPPFPPAACRELVRNGGFEAAGAWELPVTASQARVIQGEAQHGHVLLLGVLSTQATPRTRALSTAYQYGIALPANASAITLSFAVQTDEHEGEGERVVQVYDLGWNLPRLAAAPIAPSTAWRTMTVDLTQLKGQKVHLYFEVTNGGTRPNRWMAIDDVSIQACP